MTPNGKDLILHSYPPAVIDGREVNHEIAAILDFLCREIELSPSRVAEAKSRYETIGNVLIGEGSALRTFAPRVYAQGSIGLGTTVKPLKTHEFDVDLACAFSQRPSNNPDAVKKAVFDILNAHPRYKGKAATKARCVQLTYADEFHMDIMPCVPGGGTNVQVPDKRAGGWALSNPEGYADHFHEAAKRLPRRRAKMASFSNTTAMAAANATVDPFPEFDSLTKMPLQRCVQLLKRHRDKLFYDDNSRAPSSIIITTLAVSSYIQSIENNEYDCPIELLMDVVKGLPEFIGIVQVAPGVTEYIVPNPVLKSENFASKWKENPEFPKNFYFWQQRALRSLEEIAKKAGKGLQEIGQHLASDYGQDAATTAIRQFSTNIQEKSRTGHLHIGTRDRQGNPQSHRVQKHTNYGSAE